MPGKLPESPVCGVYSGYESDYMGAFDVAAGVAITKPESQLALQAGEYLVFSATGLMPQTVLQTWGGGVAILSKQSEHLPQLRNGL